MKVVHYEILRRSGDNAWSLAKICVSRAEVFTDIGRFPIGKFRTELEPGGRFTTKVVKGMLLDLNSLGVVVAGDVPAVRIEPIEFIKELDDAVSLLSGGKTSSDECLRAFKHLIENPGSSPALEALRRSYVRVPEHRRKFLLGNIDYKDFPIRAALAGTLSREDVVDLYDDYEMAHLHDPSFRPIAYLQNRIEERDDL